MTDLSDNSKRKLGNRWSRRNIFLPILLVLLSSCFFYFVNSTVAEFHNWPSIKYTSGDSTSYLNTGKWLFHEVNLSEVERSVATRPFLYPLIVVSLEKLHPWAILIYQFVLWQTQILLVYFCGMLISRSPAASFCLALISISILSPIGISLHVLTETTVSFLLTLSAYMIVLYNKIKDRIVFIFCSFLSLSLCSVIRPSYIYIYIKCDISTLYL